MMARLPESYSKNGVPFPWTGVINQDKNVAVREPSNRPMSHGDKATIQGRNGAALNQPQTFSKEGPLSLGMNMDLNSTEARNSGMLGSSIEAKTGSTNATETTNTEYKFQWKKISRSARKRYHMLKEEGIPMEEARKLCRIDRSTLEHMLSLNPQKRNNSEALQGPPKKTPKTSTEIDKQSLSSNDMGPLRVGITNSQYMSEDQMRMLRLHLITAIKEQCSDGCGPVFLGFSHKAGWVLVTCGNQRSKDWLVNAVPYQEPWPGAQLSIIPDQELPKPPRAVTLIPDSEGVSVDEALKLFKLQNSGLYTELWKVRFEKVEKEGKTVYFTIDDASADALRAQNCQASFGFETVTFKINGQYRVYTPQSTQSQVPATQGGSSKPLSQSLGGKSSKQSKEATLSNKVGPSSAARCQLPTGRDQVQPIRHQDFQPPAQGSGDITSWKKPAAPDIEQSISQNRGETRPITQNCQGHGKTPLIQSNLGGHVIRESSTSARGLAPQAASRAAQQINQDSRGHGKTPLIQPSLGRPVIRESSISAKGLAPQAASRAAQQINQDSRGHGKTPLIQPSLGRPVIRESSISARGLPPQATTRAAIQNNTNTQHMDSQSGMTPAMGRFGSAGETVFGVDGLALTNREISSQRVSPSHGGSFDRNRTNGTIGLDKSSRATTGGTHQAKNNSSSCGGAFALKKVVTARELTLGGFGARPIIQNPLSGRTPFTRFRENLTESRQGGFSALGKGNFSQAGVPPIIGRAFVQNGVGTATVSNLDGFSGPSHASSWFEDRPIIRDSQFGRTMSHDRRVTHRTSDRGSALTTNQVPRSQVGAQIIPNPTHGNQAFDQGRKVTKIDLTVTDSDDAPSRDMSPEAGGGYHSWVIEDLESYTTRLTQGNSGTGTSNSAREMTSVSKLSPQGRDSYEARIIGPESHGRPFHGSRTVTGRESRPEGLLPHPSASFKSRTIEPESHVRPFHGSRTVTSRESRPEGLLPHPSGSFESRTIEPESHVRPFHGSRTVTSRESRPEGLLPHPSASFKSRTIEPESHVRPFHGSRTVTGRESRPEGLLPHPSGSFKSRTIEPESRGRPAYGNRTMTGQSRLDKGLVPPFESRTIEPESHRRPFQGSRETVTDRGSMSNRRLLPQGRSSSGGSIQDTGHGRLQGSKGTLTDGDSRSDRRLSPLARGRYGGRIQEPETHERLQGSKEPLTDRDLRSDRRLSPRAEDSYGDRQDPETPFHCSKRSLTDRDSMSDRLSPHTSGYSAWTIEEPQRRGISWDSSTARHRARMN